MMHKAWKDIEEMPYFLKVICEIWKSQEAKKCQYWANLSISGLLLKVEFTDD